MMNKTELHTTKGLALLFAVISGMGVIGTVGALEQKGGDVSWWQLVAFAIMFVACILMAILTDTQEELDELKASQQNARIKVHNVELQSEPSEFKTVPRDKPCLNYRPTWDQGVPDEDGKVQRYRFTPEPEELAEGVDKK